MRLVENTSYVGWYDIIELAAGASVDCSWLRELVPVAGYKDPWNASYAMERANEEIARAEATGRSVDRQGAAVRIASHAAFNSAGSVRDEVGPDVRGKAFGRAVDAARAQAHRKMVEIALDVLRQNTDFYDD